MKTKHGLLIPNGHAATIAAELTQARKRWARGRIGDREYGAIFDDCFSEAKALGLMADVERILGL